MLLNGDDLATVSRISNFHCRLTKLVTATNILINGNADLNNTPAKINAPQSADHTAQKDTTSQSIINLITIEIE